MLTTHLTSDLQEALAILMQMLQKYCARREKVQPRHTKSSNCDAKWCAQSKKNPESRNCSPSGTQIERPIHKAQNPCARQAECIVEGLLQIHHACQRFCISIPDVQEEEFPLALARAIGFGCFSGQSDQREDRIWKSRKPNPLRCLRFDPSLVHSVKNCGVYRYLQCFGCFWRFETESESAHLHNIIAFVHVALPYVGPLWPDVGYVEAIFGACWGQFC